METPFLLSSPICIGIITTNRCNLKCRHCINNASSNQGMELSKEKIFSLIDQAYDMGVHYIDFNGGEFFMRDDVDLLIDYALLKGVKVTITTNGTLINDTWIEKYAGKVDLVRISLDSDNKFEHDKFRGVEGAFEKTIKNIKKLIANKFRVTILSTIRKSSIPRLFDFLSFLDALQVEALHTTLMIPAGRGESLKNDVLTPLEHREFLNKCLEFSQKYNPKHLRILEESPQAKLLEYELNGNCSNVPGKCGAAFTEMVVLNDGYVLPCAAFIALREKFQIDDLNSNKYNLQWIYNNSSLFNALRDINSLEGKCKECKLKLQCGGGCRITSIISNNGIYGEDVMCWY